MTASVACPPRSNQTTRGLDTTPLDVWRSRAELPACLAPYVPADVDFAREMLVADLPARPVQLEIVTPAPPLRDGNDLFIEEQAPFRPCPLCRGAVDNLYPPTRPEPRPTRVWRIPRVTGVQVFYRLRPHPHSQACPPCTAP